jgi:chaperonin GroEL
MDQIADLLQPTLGPLGGRVLIASNTRSKAGASPSDGGFIARRVVQVSPRADDMGAMLLRHLAWKMSTNHGGGAATAVVMARALARHLLRGLEGGFDPCELTREINALIDEAERRLFAAARPVTRRRTIENAIRQSLPEPGLAELVADALDTLGASAVIRIKQGSGSTSTCSYQEGSSWTLRCASRYLLPDDESDVQLVDARILTTDIALRSPEQITPILDRMVTSGYRSIAVVAPEIGDAIVSLLHVNQQRGVLHRAFAVLTPATARSRSETLDDISTITGARVISANRGDDLRQASLDDLGAARLVWGRASTFGIRGGGGEPTDRLRAIARLQAAKREAGSVDLDRIDKRIGNLAGVAAEICLPAGSESASAELTQRVESAIATGRSLLQEGAVIGGGFAYLRALPERPQHGSPVAAFCHDALQDAFAAPVSAIVSNAGHAPASVFAHAGDHPADAFDARSGTWVDPWNAGIIDCAAVCCAAMRESVSTALQAISIDVLVRRKNPPFSELP